MTEPADEDHRSVEAAIPALSAPPGAGRLTRAEVPAPSMEPVQTRYAGCHFRSRLEAKWAVFFDHLDMEWQYEPERYMVGPKEARRTYLPDFHLTGHDLWVEVKGDPAALDPVLMYAAADPYHGLPSSPYGAARDYGLVEPRIVTVGPVPRSPGAHGLVCVVAGAILAWQRGVFTCTGGKHHLAPVGTPQHEGLDGGLLDATATGLAPCDHVRAAYVAARSARFEHGESGSPRSPSPRELPQIVEPRRTRSTRSTRKGKSVAVSVARKKWPDILAAMRPFPDMAEALADAQVVSAAQGALVLRFPNAELARRAELGTSKDDGPRLVENHLGIAAGDILGGGPWRVRYTATEEDPETNTAYVSHRPLTDRLPPARPAST